MLLGLVTRRLLLSLRGLWLGPLLIERHGYSLVQSGNVALVVSLVSLFTPALFGGWTLALHAAAAGWWAARWC